MPSSPFGSINGRTTSRVACHHSPLTANMVGRRQALHAITAFSNQTRSNDVGRGMTSTPLNSIYGQTTSGVTCYHRLWTAHTVKKCRVWIYITALGLHPLSDDIGRGMTSPPLDSTHSRMMSGVACHHRLWEAHTVERRWVWYDINAFGQHLRSNDVGRGMPSLPLDSIDGQTTSGVA